MVKDKKRKQASSKVKEADLKHFNAFEADFRKQVEERVAMMYDGLDEAEQAIRNALQLQLNTLPKSLLSMKLHEACERLLNGEDLLKQSPVKKGTTAAGSTTTNEAGADGNQQAAAAGGNNPFQRKLKQSMAEAWGVDSKKKKGDDGHGDVMDVDQTFVDGSGAANQSTLQDDTLQLNRISTGMPVFKPPMPPRAGMGLKLRNEGRGGPPAAKSSMARKGGASLTTPAGAVFTVPSIITPKVDGRPGASGYREPNYDELSFSVRGSPLRGKSKAEVAVAKLMQRSRSVSATARGASTIKKSKKRSQSTSARPPVAKNEDERADDEDDGEEDGEETLRFSPGTQAELRALKEQLNSIVD